MRLAELTQFAFAKGEETVIGLSHQADAVFKAIDASFSDDPDGVMNGLWNRLMGKVHYRAQLNDEDFMEHNRRMAEQFTNQRLD